MTTRRRTHSLGGRLAGLALGLVAISAAAVAPVFAAEPAAPQLSIAIDNGSSTASVGDQLNYTVTIKNLGPNSVEDLVVTQSLPPGLTFESADSQGTSSTEKVTWSLSLEANSEVTLNSTTTVGATPDTLLRLASVACASTSATAAPIVCATDSDQLPAGAAAESAAAPTAPSENGIANLAWVWWIVGAAAVVLGALALVLFPRRRRRRARTR